MDDFYTACREKVQNAVDPTVGIDELTAISLQDLPKMQVCKFAEQSVTLLSVIFQIENDSPQDLTIRFQRIRQQLAATLDYMEQIMLAEKKLPSSQQPDGCWW